MKATIDVNDTGKAFAVLLPFICASLCAAHAFMLQISEFVLCEETLGTPIFGRHLARQVQHQNSTTSIPVDCFLISNICLLSCIFI